MMPTIMRVCGAIEGAVRSIGFLGFVLFPALILCCVYEVASRYLFNAPTIWAFDVTFMLHGSLFALSGAYGLHKKVHVRIDVLSARRQMPVQHAVNLLAYVFLFIPAICLVGDAAVRRAWAALRSGEVELMSAWGPLVWPLFTALAVGVVALALQSVVEVVRHASGLFADRETLPQHATARNPDEGL